MVSFASTAYATNPWAVLSRAEDGIKIAFLYTAPTSRTRTNCPGIKARELLGLANSAFIAKLEVWVFSELSKKIILPFSG